jgi:N-acetylglucosaminyldiphosphoundecaprenol N-acetyl-beta-D-mannosaminyltransferase
LRAAAFSTCDVLGVRCFVGDLNSACDAVVEHALAGRGGYGVLCNVHVLMTARRTPAVMHALDAAWHVFPDGAPIAWLQRYAGVPSAHRVGGPDLMSLVLDRGREHGLRHAFFGSTEHVVTTLRRATLRRFPGAKIIASHAPAVGVDDDADALAQVSEQRPHIIWCALGAPKQELWMARHSSTLAPALVMGVGAAFDFLAGTKPRAPRWAQRSGLEWAFRLSSEPRRLLWRYLDTNSAFAWTVVSDRFRGRA